MSHGKLFLLFLLTFSQTGSANGCRISKLPSTPGQWLFQVDLTNGRSLPPDGAFPFLADSGIGFGATSARPEGMEANFYACHNPELNDGRQKLSEWLCPPAGVGSLLVQFNPVAGMSYTSFDFTVVWNDGAKANCSTNEGQ